MRHLFTSYINGFKKYPIRMNMVNGGIIMCIGDNLAQTMEQKSNAEPAPRDFQRTAIMMSYNMFISCPFWLTVFSKLDGRWPADTFSACVKKSLMCQFIGNFTCLMFVSYSTSMRHVFRAVQEGDTSLAAAAADIIQKAKDKLPTIIGVGTLFWIPNNTLIFYCVPRHLRLLYGNCLAILWSSFLSWVQHWPNAEEDFGPTDAAVTASEPR